MAIVSAISLFASCSTAFLPILDGKESYRLLFLLFACLFSWEIINFVINENLGSTGGSLDYCMSSDFSLL